MLTRHKLTSTKQSVLEVFAEDNTNPIDALHILCEALCTVFNHMNPTAVEAEKKAMLEILFKNIRNEILPPDMYYRDNELNSR